MNDKEVEILVNQAHEATLLKRILAGKLKRYCGINHAELELICTMFGIEKEVDEE